MLELVESVGDGKTDNVALEAKKEQLQNPYAEYEAEQDALA